MVLPGVRTDPRRPGGMPDSGSVNPGGPMPSVPQGTRQPNMGAGLGEPDPKKIEEMFTQYTTGQITREDLFEFLHKESEGRGGILGLLESIGQESEKSGSQPIGSPGSTPPQPQPQPAAVENGRVISPGAARVTIPSLEEPLDARHQKISALLQGYGLGPADADQLSTILNKHVQGSITIGHEDTSGEGQGLGDPSAPETPQSWEDKSKPDEMAIRQEQWKEDKEQAAIQASGGSIGDMVAAVNLEDAEKAAVSIVPELPVQPSVEEDDGEVPWKPESVYTPEVTDTPSTVISDRPGQLDLYGGSIIPKGTVRKSDGATWDGTQWVDKPAVIDLPTEAQDGEPNPNGDGTVWDSATKSYVAPAKKPIPYGEADYSTNPFYKGFVWPEGVPEQGGHYSNNPIFEDDMWWPNWQAHRDFKKIQKEQGIVWSQVSKEHPDGQRLREFEGWSGGKQGVGTAQWERGLLIIHPSDGKEYRFVDGETVPAEQTADRFYKFGYFPDGTWLKGFGPGTGKPMPPGFTQLGSGSSTVWKPPADPVVKPSAELPSGAVVDAAGNITIDGKDIGFQDLDGTVTLNPDFVATQGDPMLELGQPGATPTTAAGAGLDLQATRHKAPMLTEFISNLTEEMFTATDNTDLAKSMISALSELDMLKMTGDQALVERMSRQIQDQLDRTAVTTRADADRAFNEGVAIGELEKGITLAAIAEQNKQAFGLAQQSGYLPIWNENTKSWRIPTAAEVKGGQAIGGVEREALRITEEDKNRQYSMDLTSLFGTYVNPEGDPNKSMETLAMQQFGLTKALQIAETTGKIPTDWTGSSSFTNVDTFAMRRFTHEKDMATRNANLQDRLATNAEQTRQTNLTIANNRNTTERAIASGNLAEAVESRKAQTTLANSQLELERDRMKLDTLMSLSNPASFLFAQRFGLLDDIGAALGIDWGEDVMAFPRMLPDNYIPSLTEFQDATPMQREIMLAEMSSSGGYTSDEAVRRIIEGAPGGRDIQRLSIMGASR